MTPPTPAAGRIELIIGCMYSGKTTEIIRRIQMYQTLKKPIAIFTHQSDTRYDVCGNIVSHNRNSIKAIPLNELSVMREKEIYQQAEIVLVEDGQFIHD